MKAESSTIKQVSGALRLAGFFIISSINFLRQTTLSDSRNQLRGDLCERQYIFGAASLNCHARHAEDRATGFVLCNRVATGPAYLAKPGSAVASHTGHYHGARRRPKALGDRV